MKTLPLNQFKLTVSDLYSESNTKGKAQELAVGKNVATLKVVPPVARCVQHIKIGFSFFLLFLNPVNFNLKNHSKMILK